MVHWKGVAGMVTLIVLGPDRILSTVLDCRHKSLALMDMQGPVRQKSEARVCSSGGLDEMLNQPLKGSMYVQPGELFHSGYYFPDASQYRVMRGDPGYSADDGSRQGGQASTVSVSAGAPRSGMTTVNSVPTPTSLCTSIRPP